MGYFKEDVDPLVLRAFSDFLLQLGRMGLAVEDADFRGVDEALQEFYPIRRAEATAFHMRWLQTCPELYGEDVRRLLELGKEVPAIDYVAAQNSRPSLIDKFVSSMKGFDAMAVPCTSTTAPVIGQETVTVSERTIDVYTALNRLTLPFNVAGFPALSIPIGQVGGLPVGAQLVARPFEESTLLALGDAYEKEIGPYPVPKGR